VLTCFPVNSLRDYVLMGPSEANEPGALRPAVTLGPVGRDSLKYGDSRSMALRCVLLTRERQAETPLARRNLAFEPVPIGELPTPSRKRDGVLVYGSAPPDAHGPGRGKSRPGGGFRRLSARSPRSRS